MSWDETIWKWGMVLLSSVLMYCGVALVGPIIRPTIIPYPWPETKNEKKRKTVVLAGSFNPPHNGHLAMIQYLVERYGDVIVVVGMNPNKKYLVSPEERANLIRRMLDGTGKHVRVHVASGYVWRAVKPMGAHIFCRGIRSWATDGQEERNLQILNTWGPLVFGPLWWPLPTVFLEGHPRYNHVSSTLIRNLCSGQQSGQDLGETSAKLKDLVPESIVQDVAALYSVAK